MNVASRGTVLVVDDDARNRKLVETLLRAEGFTVEAVESGPAALARVADILPDLVVLDLMMPGMDGFDVVRRLKAGANSARLPIVMVTALDDEGSRARLAAAGVDRVLVKPIDRWRLKRCIEELLGLQGEPT
jgi:CheY-like chemotaxis protein